LLRYVTIAQKIFLIEKIFVTFEICEYCTDKFFYKKVSLDNITLKLIVTGDSMTIQT